jgi:diguanylate cyclase (GGDEF)-like protein
MQFPKARSDEEGDRTEAKMQADLQDVEPSVCRDPVPLLLVDDREENRIAMRAALDPLDETLLEARSGEEALRILMDQECACVLLDVDMPGMDGFETASLIRRHPRLRGVPILFVTAHGRFQRVVVQGYEAGAVDFLFKPVDPKVLRAKTSVFAALFRTQRALRRANAQLREASQRDALTGLYNRRALGEMLRRELARSVRYGAPVSMLLVDVDDFKRINTVCGHAGGDRVLVRVAEVLEENVRDVDFVARIGGDEFFVLLPDADRHGAERVANRLLEAVRRASFPSGTPAVRSSMAGLSLAPAAERRPLDLAEVLRRLHTAFDEAKRSGKDCIRMCA